MSFLSTLRDMRRTSRALPNPRVSVAISTLDRRDSLERTLIALRELTYPSFEVVVVDGPSTDGTAELLAGFEGQIRVGRCDVASLGASRNIAIAMAAGDLIAFLDDDAIPPPDWLEQLVLPFRDPTVAAAGGPVFDVPLDRVDWKLCTCTRLGAPIVDSPGAIEDYAGAGADPFAYFAGCNMMIRRSALRSIHGFNPLLNSAYDDADICARLNDAGYELRYVESATVRHDRAPNVSRDEHQHIRDPYRTITSRAAFMLQSDHAPHISAVTSELHGWLQDWRNVADAEFAVGRLTAAARDHFVQRAIDGVRDGLEAALAPRALAHIPKPPHDLFLQHRAHTSAF